jgi:hypothetical protein
MKKRAAVLGMSVAVLIVALALGSWALAQSDDGQPPMDLSGSDEDPTAQLEVVIPERYQPDKERVAPEASPQAELYFAPQDNNANTTVLFLYNTSAADATVRIQAFKATGEQIPTLDTEIAVPAGELVRIAADTLVDTAPLSWEDTIRVNFSDATAYARMTLPRGIKVDGYVTWNGGTRLDPNAAVPTLPLRFSTDPATVFLPAITTDQP